MRLMKASRHHQHTSYKGLAKPALRMFNGFLTFHYGTLNSSCYDGDSAPGGGLLLSCEPLCGPRCRRSPRGGRVSVPPGTTPAPLPACRRREDGFKKRGTPARLTDPSLLGYLRRR